MRLDVLERWVEETGHPATADFLDMLRDYPETQERIRTAPCPVRNFRLLIRRVGEQPAIDAHHFAREVYGTHGIRFPHRLWLFRRDGEVRAYLCPSCATSGEIPAN